MLYMSPPYSPPQANLAILDHQLILVILVHEPKETLGRRMLTFPHSSSRRVAIELYWTSSDWVPIAKPITMDWLLERLPIQLLFNVYVKYSY